MTKEDIAKNSEASEENIALLKNAMELWRASSRTADAVTPILHHYSWHLFNAFFAYSFFRWEPEHARSHGLQIDQNTLDGSFEDIKIKILREKDAEGRTLGLFQRLIDTWVLLGSYSAFSSHVPMLFNDETVDFVPNNQYLFKSSHVLSLKQLLAFKADIFAKFIHSREIRENTFRSYGLPSVLMLDETLRDFLVSFVASSFARYRPMLWNSVLLGEIEEKADFADAVRQAFAGYTVGHPSSFLGQVDRLFQEIIDGKLKIYWRHQKK